MCNVYIKNTPFLVQTEEDFLDALTQGFPDDSVQGDEEESDESEEEREEEQAEKSQNGGRRSQSLHLPVEMGVDVASMVSDLQLEGETSKYLLSNKGKHKG